MFCKGGYNFKGCGSCSIKLNDSQNIGQLSITVIFELYVNLCELLRADPNAIIVMNDSILMCNGNICCNVPEYNPNINSFFILKSIIKCIMKTWYRANKHTLTRNQELDILIFKWKLKNINDIQCLNGWCNCFFDIFSQ